MDEIDRLININFADKRNKSDGYDVNECAEKMRELYTSFVTAGFNDTQAMTLLVAIFTVGLQKKPTGE